MAHKLEKLVSVDRPIRIHWTGCPNSCGQVQAADIGIMGGPARKEVDGKMMAVLWGRQDWGRLALVAGTLRGKDSPGRGRLDSGSGRYPQERIRRQG